MNTLQEIDSLSKKYSDALIGLRNVVQELNDEVEMTRRKFDPKIRTSIGSVKEKRYILESAIENSPDLFVKPRTHIFHGVKVGFKKAIGKLQWGKDAVEQIIKLIKKNHPDDVDRFIKTTEKPNKKNLSELSANELKRLGIQVSENGDEVYIEATDSEVDKIVKAFLKETPESEIDDDN